MPATVATVLTAAVLSILAYGQFGSAGVIAIAAFALATIASVWIATFGALALGTRHPQLSALFASSGVRMVMPLVIVLAIVVSNGRWVPVETAYYVVPMYLCMLVADVAVWVREKRKVGEAG